jgi:hypothetical protein
MHGILLAQRVHFVQVERLARLAISFEPFSISGRNVVAKTSVPT